MKRSHLHRLHRELEARFVDFGGWEMPLQYRSVLAEHRAVREGAGWFDVSHLGRFLLTGPGAETALLRLLCNDVTRIEPGRTQYTLMLNDEGGIVDDLLVWWWEPGRYWVLPNAANHQRVMAAFAAEPDCRVADLQTSTVFLAVQGPEAPAVLTELFGEAPKRYRTLVGEWRGHQVHMAGTGYTGERGGEVCAEPESGEELARALVAGGIEPCGLGARDTLRLEAGLPLWGSDLDEGTTPLEAGLDFAVEMGHEFVGREALAAQLEAGPGRRLSGFVLDEPGVPRHGYPARAGSSRGQVTSGNISPMIHRGIGLATLTPPAADGAIEIEIRGRWVRGHLAQPPFHREAP